MTLSRRQATRLASSLRQQFNHYADFMGIKTIEYPPGKGYTILIETNAETSFSYIREVGEAAKDQASRLKGGKGLLYAAIPDNDYPVKKKGAPKPH